MWGYKIKYLENGFVDKFKAKLVAKGYNQIKGLDCFDTYSLVSKLNIVIFVLALVSLHNWHLHHLDVNNYFYMESFNMMFT